MDCIDFTWLTSQDVMEGDLNKYAFWNMYSIEVTLDVSQLRGLLKRWQLANIESMEVTLLTSQASSVELNVIAYSNALVKSVTELVSQLERSALNV